LRSHSAVAQDFDRLDRREDALVGREAAEVDHFTARQQHHRIRPGQHATQQRGQYTIPGEELAGQRAAMNLTNNCAPHRSCKSEKDHVPPVAPRLECSIDVHDAWLAANEADGKRQRIGEQAEQCAHAVLRAIFAADLELEEAEAAGKRRFEQLIEVRGNPAHCAARRTERQDARTAVFDRHAATVFMVYTSAVLMSSHSASGVRSVNSTGGYLAVPTRPYRSASICFPKTSRR
jgi:hypothetical protein